MGKKLGEFISYLSIKPNYCVDYCRYIPTPEEAFDRQLPLKNTSNGKMSRAARSRLMNAINWMVLFSPRKKVYRKAPKKPFFFKINFITLTLSDAQNHPDEWIKAHMLEPFLKWMKRSHNAINYVWRSETQENGNIHFHITTNKYIWVKSVQNKWNSLQQNHGYLKHYFNKYGHHEAPSTEIKAVKNTRELAIYMGKYFAKERPERQPWKLTTATPFYDPINFELQLMSVAECGLDNLRRAVDGKQWACSTALTKLAVSINESDTDYWEERKWWIENQTTEMNQVDFCKIYITKWNMNSNAPSGIARKIAQLEQNFNKGDNHIKEYLEQQ